MPCYTALGRGARRGRRPHDGTTRIHLRGSRQRRRCNWDRARAMDFATRAIHAGQAPDPSTGATITPIFQTSTYTQEGLGQNKGYEYSRTGNPTRTALEACLAALENAQYGLAFSSGMAATSAILSLLRPGDHVLACDDLYGGSYRIFERVLRPMGITISYVEARDVAAYAAAIKPETKLVWIETPTNPLLTLVDIAACRPDCPCAGRARGGG